MRPLGARIVLCLHDELLVHVAGRDAAGAVTGSSTTACRRPRRGWAPGTPVRFVADVSVVERWSDAK